MKHNNNITLSTLSSKVLKGSFSLAQSLREKKKLNFPTYQKHGVRTTVCKDTTIHECHSKRARHSSAFPARRLRRVCVRPRARPFIAHAHSAHAHPTRPATSPARTSDLLTETIQTIKYSNFYPSNFIRLSIGM